MAGHQVRPVFLSKRIGLDSTFGMDYITFSFWARHGETTSHVFLRPKAYNLVDSLFKAFVGVLKSRTYA